MLYIVIWFKKESVVRFDYFLRDFDACRKWFRRNLCRKIERRKKMELPYFGRRIFLEHPQKTTKVVNDFWFTTII